MQGADAVVTVRHAAVEPGLLHATLWELPQSRGDDAAAQAPVGLLPWPFSGAQSADLVVMVGPSLSAR